MIPPGTPQCHRFTLDEMQSATGDFSDERVAGKGGFGTVYKGFIDNGSRTVAIKRLESNANQGEREFVSEIETLAKVRHHNLVPLIGYCNEQGEKILVYEYMPNGTLADHLYGPSRKGRGGSILKWTQRLKICIGAGHGLNYLHSGRTIIHRDVKSTNILLDQNFTPKVSDFGLAKDIGAESQVSTMVKGSFGYIDPSYFNTGRLTMASDTYAFGVVLLEVLSGRAAMNRSLPENKVNLAMWALERIRNGKVDQIVDLDLRGEISNDCLNTFVEVVKICLRPEPKERLTMSRVVALLESALEQQERKGLTHKSYFWNRASSGILGPVTSRSVDFGISSEQLFAISKEHDLSLLQRNGGIKGLAEKLNSNPQNGVSGNDTDLITRKQAFGMNTYPVKKGDSFWSLVWDACRDTILIILMIAAIGSLVLATMTEGIKEGWYEGGSIAFAVLILIICTAVRGYKQSLQFQKLREEVETRHVEVIRSGSRMKVSIVEIVVGDVVQLNIGDQVPADGFVISGHALLIDESSLTGEQTYVCKDSERSSNLMSGCKVVDGYGTMLVTGVGINTERGSSMARIIDNDEATPLQVRLNAVVAYIRMAGLAVAFIVLIVAVARFFTGHTKDPNGQVQFIARKTKVGDVMDGVIKIFTAAVTIVFVAEPTVLPLAVTLMLARSMRKMMADKALIRRLSACETMGAATTICSDKTGTLTLNQMAVVEAYACGMKVDPPDNKSLLPSTAVSLLIESIAQNTTGSVFEAEGGGALELSGSPTEKAILQWGVNLGMDFHSVRSGSDIIHISPFNSQTKRGGVALKLSDSEGRVFWKGEAEAVLASCTSYIDRDDHVVPLDENKVLSFKKAIEDMGASSLRCVAIAYRPCNIESEGPLQDWHLPDSDLSLLAIVGIKDPCRPSVRDAVQLCTSAGVKVRMVTGDNLLTARAIALECGIIVDSNKDSMTEPNIIEGKAFRSLTEEQRVEVAEKISVMGRSSPNDKLLLVQALRQKGHVVAVTGDDAPALYEADIGLAMGIQGTDIAKESSDIIVLDDDFASVVKVIRWGRCLYFNIQKFIQFQLTVIVAALIINVVAVVSSGNVPLSAVQLLWVHLIVNTFGALALATEPPTDHLMHRPPVHRREPLITNIMWRNVLIQVIYQLTVLLILNFWGRDFLNMKNDTSGHASRVNNTLIFNAFVFCQVFNKFNVRKPDEINVWKGVTRSHLFMGIIVLEVVVQFIIISLLGKLTSTVRLSWKFWLLSVAIGFISWPVAAIGKLITVPKKPLATPSSRKIEEERIY